MDNSAGIVVRVIFPQAVGLEIRVLLSVISFTWFVVPRQ